MTTRITERYIDVEQTHCSKDKKNEMCESEFKFIRHPSSNELLPNMDELRKYCLTWQQYIFTGRGQGNIFTPVRHSFCSQGGCLPQCMLGYPPKADPPRTRHPPPGTRLPWSRQPLDQTPPSGPDPPPREADSSIRSTSGRYASYWNAFVLLLANTFQQLLCSYSHPLVDWPTTKVFVL